MDVGGVDLALGEAERGEKLEARIVELGEVKPELLDTEFFAERPLVEGELDVEGGGQGLFNERDRLGREALGFQRRVVDAGRLAEIAVADGIGLNLGDVGFRIAEHTQRFPARSAVDDLEVAAARRVF